MRKLLGLFVIACLAAMPLAAQGTGSISGKVTAPDGDALPGVQVVASSEVLPQPMTASSGADGSFRFPFLPPGSYTLTFSMQAMAEQTRAVTVRLDANSNVAIAMAPDAIEAEIDVIDSSTMIDPSSAEIKNSIDNQAIEALPVGQEYRDLQKLIPGVTYSENTSRGPSAGGSGQDNVYLFDGVNVNLPLFGVLSAEPSSHDIDQVSVIKGGAKAVDFNRSAGLTINSISKSGTNQFRGEVSYQVQNHSMTSDQRNQVSEFDEDKDWATASLGGPIVRDMLYFYASYYRPTVSRDNRANAYGEVQDYDSTRDELFGRLSFQPTNNLLIHGSYRDSDREVDNASIGAFEAATASLGEEATLKIGILEGTWTINNNSYATFKLTDFENQTGGVPDTLFGFSPAGDGSVPLNIGALETQGYVNVPSPIAGEDAYNAFIQPFIDQYGYLDGGVRVGGGAVGGYFQVNNQDFFRESYQVGYDWLFGSNLSHELHFGYQWYKDEEDLDRHSNGWGEITVLGGRLDSPNGTPAYFLAEVLQTGVVNLPGGDVGVIHSEFESQSVEVNDTIRWGDWTFNAGVVLSNDELYGQGLRENSGNVSGFETCLSCTYKMYEVDFEDQIQPRLGAIWAYAPEGTVYANWARYNPAASSLPRAASWARSNAAILDAYFDAAGNLIEIETRASSSGKFFQPDLDPRATDEYLIGTSRQLNSNLAGRLTARYRRSYNFWEDTNNNARQFGNAPADISHELYIPELNDYRTEVGGSTYVIAELDNVFTKFYEVAAEAEWRGPRTYLNASYVWSHYYGNFDQDNTTVDNDQAIFIGSSNYADGPGRQAWDMKYGNLNGDRRHKLKVYGYYTLDWNATAGAFAIYQSGEPWEAWNVEVYRAFTGSTIDTIRNSEPAGSRETDDHYQLDLNYTQSFDLGDRFELQLIGDIFNVFDKQTGYAPQRRERLASFGTNSKFYDPRRFQLTARLRF
jgi:hypothetical protein